MPRAQAEAVAEGVAAELHDQLEQRLQRLETGLAGVQAELAEVRTEIAELRTELRTGLADLRMELRTEVANLRAEMHALKVSLLMWLIPPLAGQLLVTMALVVNVLLR